MSLGATRRQRARRGQGERLREEILEATERLLISTGDAEAVSIRAVAEAVGVTPPSIYLHFVDKDELLFAVCERHFARLDRLAEEAGAGSGDPLESLRLRGRAYIRFGLEHPEQYRILFMGKPARVPEGFAEERLRRSAAFDHVVQAVQRCVDAGSIRPEDPVLVAIGLWAAVHGMTSLLISKPDFPWPERDLLIDHLLAVQIEGLRR
ncbi:MAG: TetR/AcrR family transcriptional regulator [Actinomycetota bacterium]